MFKKLSIAFWGLLVALALPTAAQAETVVEKAARTGIITLGTRTDVIPFSYVNDKKELVGYSIDVANLIEQVSILGCVEGELEVINMGKTAPSNCTETKACRYRVKAIADVVLEGLENT